MISELKNLLSNSYAPYDYKCFACIVVMKDGTKFKGAIARAVTAGYKYGDFETLYMMVGTDKISDLKYLNERVITEFFEPEKSIILYTLNEDNRVLKVGNLYNNIY